MVTELQLNNEKLQIQISEIIARSSKESMSSPKKPIKVTKEVAKTSNSKKLKNTSILAFWHTLANGEIKILTGDEHQFRRTIKVLEKQKVEYHSYQLKTEKKFLVPQANNKDIYDIKNLYYHIIKVEPPRKNKEVPQCKNCQIFGHTQNYCFKTPKCVKFSEGHTSLNCPKSKKSKAKCANCGEGHTANWKGCITYKNALEKTHPKKTMAVQRI
ncbi:hypothetical protein QTP88_015563 [Uroleucon formosanum]